ncbi:bifunctional oligoribonuclease/PAP phosphatase NrnA [Halobacteriovorax sp. GB3]|uniref:DHH family phosphoesterase n=1 Tax=Halobacteriovorax sp. GB3 TaxID=2719615 RepID=UPI002361C618|nr:bifunctional oligoribonuclease/PAP phosphatase NrnA [Halobacteriovorax sp. GB3]MDD0851565.1 bifunctional oligoribonuclease/PAP phosphatase NrnA [Halobacteriovorax sp. GB3]
MRIKEHFKKLTKKANKIVITTHIHPDADGIGSQIALCMALRKMGKDAICVNEEPLFERYKYLDPDNIVLGLEEYKAQYDVEQEIDLFIVADTNSLPRIGTNVQQLVLLSKDLLFIDHHPCPKELQAIHCIDTNTAATGELVGGLIEAIGVEFDEAIALALYTAIIIDTSSFRYPTVTGNTHALVSKLMAAGVKPPEAFNLINGTKKISHMQLLGKVLSSAQTTKDETIAWICLTEQMIENHESDAEDTHGFINHLLILDNIKVACMFRKIGKQVKVSLRSSDDSIDVGIMAQALGGGGHNHSAATVVEGELSDVVKRTISKIEKMLSQV